MRAIDPFRDTTAGGGFFGGDPFVVYPGPDGQPWESIRHRVFTEAMDDHRAMQLLASLSGGDVVRSIVDPDGALTLTTYPSGADHYRQVALRLAEMISASTADADAAHTGH